VRNNALEAEKIRAVETAAVRMQLLARHFGKPCSRLKTHRRFKPDLLISNRRRQPGRVLQPRTGGLHRPVIDVSGGDKIPRKARPCITQSDLLVITKRTQPRRGRDLTSWHDQKMAATGRSYLRR
jgi:hypothetical protein